MFINTRIVALVTALLFASQASAITIGSGDTFTVDWYIDATTTSGLNDDLSATSTWTVSSYSSTSIVLDISITNTTLLSSTLTNADIVSFGFGVVPDATGTLLSPGSVFDGIASGSGPQQTYPGGFKQIDVCVYSSGCSGGSVTSALHAGLTDSLQIELTSTTLFGSTIDLLFFPVKFQTSQGSYAAPGCVAGSNCTPVPEPPVPLLLGLGLLGIGLARRMRA